MQFGKVINPESIDFTLPEDNPNTKDVFEKYGNATNKTEVYVGCAKWGRKDLKNFYPKSVKTGEELEYYSSQFNSIEMNSTFYRIFPESQYEKWKNKTPSNFKFFPKIFQEISHYKQLNDYKDLLDRYLNAVSHFGEKLGTIYLQMNERFGIKQLPKLQSFVEDWPVDLDLSVELRHADWYADEYVFNELIEMLTSKGVAHTLVDTAGRRDLLHMCMTTPKPFIRYVGANHVSDYKRLDDWVIRIGEWMEQGMTELNFFIHQNLEVESPLLSAYFIEKLNANYGFGLTVPQGKQPSKEDQQTLF